MELAAHKHCSNYSLRITHTPRELNTWADQLAKPDFDGFGPMNQITPNETNFVVLDKLLRIHYHANS